MSVSRANERKVDESCFIVIPGSTEAVSLNLCAVVFSIFMRAIEFRSKSSTRLSVNRKRLAKKSGAAIARPSELIVDRTRPLFRSASKRPERDKIGHMRPGIALRLAAKKARQLAKSDTVSVSSCRKVVFTALSKIFAINVTRSASLGKASLASLRTNSTDDSSPVVQARSSNFAKRDTI